MGKRGSTGAVIVPQRVVVSAIMMKYEKDSEVIVQDRHPGPSNNVMLACHLQDTNHPEDIIFRLHTHWLHGQFICMILQ